MKNCIYAIVNTITSAVAAKAYNIVGATVANRIRNQKYPTWTYHIGE